MEPDPLWENVFAWSEPVTLFTTELRELRVEVRSKTHVVSESRLLRPEAPSQAFGWELDRMVHDIDAVLHA